MFLSTYSTGGKYGFAEQIIDGMCVSINSVIVNFKSKAFAASIQVSIGYVVIIRDVFSIQLKLIFMHFWKVKVKSLN